jgi:glycerophosphoryl diester phosphodiesterase
MLASAVLAGILSSLFLGIGVVIYGRSGGKELAERLGVPRPAIIAHRGASYFAPEETGPAYLLAREMGVDYLELDLQRTKDGVLIALHDDDLRRTTNVAEVFPKAMMRRDGWDAILRSAKQVADGIGPWGYGWSRDPGWSVKDAPTRYVMVWPWYTGQAHRAGLLVHPWTIDDRWEMRMVSLFGADGFFTNRPDLALLFYGRADRIDLKPMWKKIGY